MADASVINDPLHWRDRAKRARALAEQMKHELSKQMMYRQPKMKAAYKKRTSLKSTRSPVYKDHGISGTSPPSDPAELTILYVGACTPNCIPLHSSAKRAVGTCDALHAVRWRDASGASRAGRGHGDWLRTPRTPMPGLR
jgi:hypothetical protein